MSICANWFSYGADSSAPKSSDFGLVVTCENPYESSERDRTIYSVPGRNGDIIIDNGRYANVSVTYTVNLHNVTPAKIDAIREWLLTPITYQRIYDSYDSTCYREGIFAGNIGWTLTQLQRHGSASITFNCKPQRWLVTGDTPIHMTFPSADRTSKGWPIKLTNPTDMPAFPYVVIDWGGYAVASRRVSFCDTNDLTVPSRRIVDLNLTGEWPDKSYLDFGDAIYKDEYADGTLKSIGHLSTNSFAPASLPSGESYLYIGFLSLNSDSMSADIYPRWWKI